MSLSLVNLVLKIFISIGFSGDYVTFTGKKAEKLYHALTFDEVNQGSFLLKTNAKGNVSCRNNHKLKTVHKKFSCRIGIGNSYEDLLKEHEQIRSEKNKPDTGQ